MVGAQSKSRIAFGPRVPWAPVQSFRLIPSHFQMTEANKTLFDEQRSVCDSRLSEKDKLMNMGHTHLANELKTTSLLTYV